MKNKTYMKVNNKFAKLNAKEGQKQNKYWIQILVHQNL